MKIAIYVRVSTTEQAIEGYSIPAQINVLRQYCIGYQYEIFKIYQDHGISGKNITDRPGLVELIEDSQERKFDIVLVWKLSRLSRSLLDLLSVVDILDRNNITFQSYSEKFDTSTPIGKITLQLLGSIAEFERNTIIENVKMGMNERFKSGLSKGTIPFGYIYKDKEVLTVPVQAKAVKFAFEYYNSTDSARVTTDIVDWLNGNEYKTKLGNFWTREAVRELLKNKFYAGYVSTGKLSHKRPGENFTEIIGVHSPIVSLELYNFVNEKINNLRRHPHIKNPENDCVLTGLIVCPFCGSRLCGAQTYSYYNKVSGERQKYLNKFYRCYPNANTKRCKGIMFASSKIEPQVLEKLFNIDKNILKLALNDAKNKSKIQNKPIINRIKSIDAELIEAIKIRDRYYKILETGEFAADAMNQLANKLNEIMTKIGCLEKRKDQEVINQSEPIFDFDINKFIDTVKEFKVLFSEMTNEQKKRTLRKLIKEIRIDENKQLKEIITIDGINLM